MFGEQNYSFSVDIWSAGCILAECFIGNPIFPGETDLDLLGKIFEILGPANVIKIPIFNSLIKIRKKTGQNVLIYHFFFNMNLIKK